VRRFLLGVAVLVTGRRLSRPEAVLMIGIYLAFHLARYAIGLH